MTNSNPHKRILILSAWVLILFVSDLPDILWNEITGQIPAWLIWGKICIIAVFLGLCISWKRLRPLWQYAFIFLVFYLALALSSWVGATDRWQSSFNGAEISFSRYFGGIFIRDFGIAFAVIVGLWFIKRRRSAFYLVQGKLDAPIEPVRWLGIREGESWRTFGWIFAVAASLAVFIPTILAMRPTADTLLRAVPLLPYVLLFAAINAFNEEIYYRTTILSTLPEHIGKYHAILINVIFFGLAHYLFGAPPGLIGFLMTGFLAWLLGKSMLETKGIVWAWFIHFLPDVVVFSSYAILWIQE
jgi:membrane protease YdiL (CAAX protease family)